LNLLISILGGFQANHVRESDAPGYQFWILKLNLGVAFDWVVVCHFLLHCDNARVLQCHYLVCYTLFTVTREC